MTTAKNLFDQGKQYKVYSIFCFNHYRLLVKFVIQCFHCELYECPLYDCKIVSVVCVERLEPAL